MASSYKPTPEDDTATVDAPIVANPPSCTLDGPKVPTATSGSTADTGAPVPNRSWTLNVNSGAVSLRKRAVGVVPAGRLRPPAGPPPAPPVALPPPLPAPVPDASLPEGPLPAG